MIRAWPLRPERLLARSQGGVQMVGRWLGRYLGLVTLGAALLGGCGESVRRLPKSGLRDDGGEGGRGDELKAGRGNGGAKAAAAAGRNGAAIGQGGAPSDDAGAAPTTAGAPSEEAGAA